MGIPPKHFYAAADHEIEKDKYALIEQLMY